MLKGFVMSDISSLGIGSGVLTADVIDQLKAADSSRIIKPLENKISLNNQKQDAAELLTSLMKTFKASASALSYDTIFDTKKVEVDGNAAVTVDAGANIESFTLETVSLAKKDITQFGSLASKETKVAETGNSGAFEIKDPDGVVLYSIPYDDTTSLSDLAQSITDIAGDSVEASILQTGDGAFSLVLASKETGAAQGLTFSDVPDVVDAGMKAQFQTYDGALNPTGYKNVQAATDAEFIYNGITITRSTNEITDLVIGVSITLKEEGDFSNVNISQDTENITGEMQQLTDSYNTLVSNLHDMTLKDKETGAEGVFNGDSFVKSIQRELSKIMTSIHDNDSLVNYGLDIDRYGTMSFDKSVLEEKIADNPDAVKLFFTGGVDDAGDTKTGMFSILDEKLKSYTGYGKLLSTFDAGVKTDGTNLADAYDRAKASLDSRYDIMTQRFTAYDSMISRTNSMFSSLQMMIDQASNG